jgi:membrane protease YdiL (CAAX protease family)
MRSGDPSGEDEGSLLQRIVDFPLVAMVIALAAVLVPAGLVAGLFEKTLPSSPLSGRLAVAAVMVASYKLVVPHLGTRHHDDLSGPRPIFQLFLGLAVGGAVFATIVGAAALAGVYRILGAGDTSNLLASIVGAAVFPAIAEEIIFRAILFRWIEVFAGSWAALILSSLLFGLSHVANPNADLISTIGIMLEGGILLGAAYMLTRRLWFPMGIHASWTLTQGEVFDVPVSGTDSHGLIDAKLQGPALLTGGGFGLEASLISIIIGTAAGLAILWLAVRSGRLVQPWWVRRRLSVEPNSYPTA